MAGLLTRKFHPRLQCVNSQTGDCISDTKSIGERWKEYCEELYMDNGDNKEVILEFTVNTQIWSDTSHQTHSKYKGSWAWQGASRTLQDWRRFCNWQNTQNIWETGVWLGEWTDFVFIPIPKKGDLKECKNYRTISLVSLASKILLCIILERMRRKTESEIAAEQAGFWQGRGTRDQIVNLRRKQETINSQYICVSWTIRRHLIQYHMWLEMLGMWYPPHLVQILMKKQQARVCVAGTFSEWFRIRKGVWHRCVLSPYLYNILAEMITRKVLEDFEEAIYIGARTRTIQTWDMLMI